MIMTENFAVAERLKVAGRVSPGPEILAIVPRAPGNGHFVPLIPFARGSDKSVSLFIPDGFPLW